MSTSPVANYPIARSAPALIAVNGVLLEAFAEGALWWADERLLVVADLHFEKGSSFARRGMMLPPYDTAETLSRLALLVARLDPARVIALGDSFHDDGGAARLSPRDEAALAALQARREWVWIAGNHDPARHMLAGVHAETVAIGRVLFRHEPTACAPPGEIAGHLHPAAVVAGKGKWVRRRCFAGDGHRLVLPAFGAYAGGLNVLDRAFAGLFARPTFRAYALGEDRVYAVGLRVLRPD
jgi:DNA ligase-associated metallophosphoesterase